jgi:hypothetical protein
MPRIGQLLDRAFLGEAGNQPEEALEIVPRASDCRVAVEAKEATHLTREVIVVDGER